MQPFHFDLKLRIDRPPLCGGKSMYRGLVGRATQLQNWDNGIGGSSMAPAKERERQHQSNLSPNGGWLNRLALHPGDETVSIGTWVDGRTSRIGIVGNLPGRLQAICRTCYCHRRCVTPVVGCGNRRWDPGKMHCRDSSRSAVPPQKALFEA